MSAEVRTRAAGLLEMLRLCGRSAVVQLEPADCALAAAVLEDLLTHVDAALDAALAAATELQARAVTDVEAMRMERDEAQKERALAIRALGFLTTLAPDVVIDGADWMGLADRVHRAVRQGRDEALASAAVLREALAGIIEIGKRDLTNPKYDGYFEAARAALASDAGAKWLERYRVLEHVAEVAREVPTLEAFHAEDCAIRDWCPEPPFPDCDCVLGDAQETVERLREVLAVLDKLGGGE